jgi:hypothetical protein
VELSPFLYWRFGFGKRLYREFPIWEHPRPAILAASQRHLLSLNAAAEAKSANANE